MDEAVFKLITKQNWELLAEFLDFSKSEMKKHIGYYIWWTGIPDGSKWSFYPDVPELHVTVTDNYISDRIVPQRKGKK